MTEKPAAFQASYSDWRLVKGRKVVQIVFEVPLELAAGVHDVLGGMPDPGKSVWCAIARLNMNDKATPSRAFADLPIAQQAALRCADMEFRTFLREHEIGPATNEHEAAETIRAHFGVTTRKNISARQWAEMEAQYERWRFASKVKA